MKTIIWTMIACVISSLLGYYRGYHIGKIDGRLYEKGKKYK